MKLHNLHEGYPDPLEFPVDRGSIDQGMTDYNKATKAEFSNHVQPNVFCAACDKPIGYKPEISGKSHGRCSQCYINIMKQHGFELTPEDLELIQQRREEEKLFE